MPLRELTHFKAPRRIEDYFFPAFIIFGFILALISGSAMIYYIVSFLTGMFFGRMLYNKREAIKIQYYIMVVGFMIGFVIGNALTRYGDAKLTILAYFLGILASYYLNIRGYLRIVDI